MAKKDDTMLEPEAVEQVKFKCPNDGEDLLRVGTAIGDLTSGLYLACGILTALLEREVSGEGQWVHT